MISCHEIPDQAIEGRANWGRYKMVVGGFGEFILANNNHVAQSDI
jgi:hypothetical protein